MEISSVVSPLLLLLLLSINKGKATDVLPLVEAVDRSGNILEQVTPDLIYRHVRTGKIFYFVWQRVLNVPLIRIAKRSRELTERTPEPKV